jgi:pyruvate/2-oxoglutarate dehydrogenase complex dihydrolipoamide dehydrogenase (E3) component
MNSCVDLASTNAEDIRRQMADVGVDYIEGLATFADGGSDDDSLVVSMPHLAVKTITASKILIATGSSPFRPGGIPFDANRIFDSDSINQARTVKSKKSVCWQSLEPTDIV